MESFKINHLWSLSARKDQSPQSETANIIGEDSSLLFSNRFVYDPKVHSALVKKIAEVREKAKKNFEKTNLGKRLGSLVVAADSLEEQIASGKIDKTPKVKIEKKVDALTSQEEDDLMAEIDQQALDVHKDRNTGKAPGKSGTTTKPSTDVKQLASQLAQEVKALCKATKQYATVNVIDRIEKSIEELDSYRGDTLGETYRRVVTSKEDAARNELFDKYLSIATIMDNADLQKVAKDSGAYKELSDAFYNQTQMAELSDDESNQPNGGADFFETRMQSDEFAKEIFNFMAEIDKKNGAFVGTTGNHKIVENNHDFIIDGENVSRNSLDEKYAEFVQILIKAGISDKVVKYFEALNEREDIGAEMNKYLCIKFLRLMSSGIKKLGLNAVHQKIDQEFSGTEFVNLFKSIIEKMNLYTPSIEHVNNEIVRVDKNASIKIYESNGTYYVTLHYGNLPPKTFSLESIGNRGYANYVVRGLNTNRPETLQDVYRKLMQIEIKAEVVRNKIQSPDQSQYKDSKYFPEIISEIDEEARQYASSKLKYMNFITKISQFNGTQGQPQDRYDPLAKFSMSVSYKNSVSLWIDFVKTSDQSFRISSINYAGGDKVLGARLINLLNNKSGNYNFDTNSYKDLSSVKESQRREINAKITSFYIKFLTSLVDKVAAEPAATVEQKKTENVSPEKTQYTKEQLVKIYNDFNLLSDKEKRTPAEEKKLEELTAIVSENIEDIKRSLNLHDDEGFDEFIESTESKVKSIPAYEQNKLIRRLNELYDQLESGVSKKDEPKINEEIDKINKFLVERGDFSKYRSASDGLDGLEEKLLDLSIADTDPSQKTREAAIALLKYSPFKEEYKENAKKNFEKYPELKGYIANIYSPDFVRLVYAD